MRQPLVVGDVAAHRAEAHAVADLGQHRGEPVDVRRFDGQQVKGDALRALRPDTRQLAELVDQILDRSFKHVGAIRTPGYPARAHAAGQRGPAVAAPAR